MTTPGDAPTPVQINVHQSAGSPAALARRTVALLDAGVPVAWFSTRDTVTYRAAADMALAHHRPVVWPRLGGGRTAILWSPSNGPGVVATYWVDRSAAMIWVMTCRGCGAQDDGWGWSEPVAEAAALRDAAGDPWACPAACGGDWCWAPLAAAEAA